ncbi:MAG: Phage integrase family protein [Parcubacteria group bacterium GW2011_GWA2_49_9]|nr:MAG: Phage integrase family protein [Parcubacteria group bacterium GW2011_GWA2_49_9]
MNRKEDEYVRLLGGRDAIEYALKRGGETITDLMRKLHETENVELTRERGRQIVRSIGLTGKAAEREPIWYAQRAFPNNHVLVTKLVTPKTLRKMLKQAGGIVPLSKELGKPRAVLWKIVHETIPQLRRTPAQFFHFRCDFCGRKGMKPMPWAKRALKLYPHKKWFCNYRCSGNHKKMKKRGAGSKRGRVLSHERFSSLEEAKAVVQKLGLRTKTEYRKIRRRVRWGDVVHLPSAPDVEYKGKGWTTWGNFFGTGRTRRRAKNCYPTRQKAGLAAQALGARTSTDYRKIWKQDPRLPRNPDEVYTKTWTGWSEFLGR